MIYLHTAGVMSFFTNGMNLLTQVPVHFIDNLTPIWADVIVFCATYLGIIMALCAVIYIIFRKFPYENAFSSIEQIIKRIGDFFILFITAGGAYVFSVMFKNIFMLGRPVTYSIDLHPLIDLTGYGFPSSHAAFYSAIAVTLLFMNRQVGYVAIFFAVVIGVARILAGVHSPLDILGGFILGILISSIVDFVVEKLSDWKTT